MKKTEFQMGIEIKTAPGTILKPEQIKFWKMDSKDQSVHAPFKYFTDALLGVCYHKMNNYKHLKPDEKSFAEQAYRSFDPYTELYNKSTPRTQALKKKNKSDTGLLFENFEKEMTDLWEKAFQNETVHFADLKSILTCLSSFEQKLNQPFLYNFSVDFSPAFNEKLICFYSFLFHLRSLIAVDHNAYVEDTSFESIKCDSISDYLPKSDYTVNDALLYLQFKKLSVPFVGHKDKDLRIEKLFVEPMMKSFNQYNHNACCLVDHLPSSFLNSLSHSELEEALHHVQMDWLLGSSSGLLFKIREELFGAVEGYDKIFWPELTSTKKKPASKLSLFFAISEKDLSKEFVAA